MAEDEELIEGQKANDDNYEANPSHLDGVPDMSSLIYLEAQNVLHNLEVRYKKLEVYTSISKVLIAVNPYQKLDCYGPEVIREYRVAASNIKQRLRVDNLQPHVFKVSQAAYHNMLKTQTNQSMIVCGESGSGKTESAKHLMRYLAASPDGTEVASDKISIEKQVLDANPILESFGNAKTILNNNSSRFGKFTKIVFSQSMEHIVGSFIETYLLEKSRVVKQDPNERTYHVFYMLCAGGKAFLSGQEWSELGIGAPEDFHYLNQSGCIVADGWDDAERFEELLHALKTLNFSSEEATSIFRMVAGILHLGDMEFADGQKPDTSIVTNPDKLKLAAKLFGVSEEEFAQRLLTKVLKVMTTNIRKDLSVAEALLNRDALSKALYHGLFLYIVKRINSELYEESSRSTESKWVGILDVFGFESFEHNSFEQFCINFANERLQQFFNACILKSEQEEYIHEAIQWVPIKVPDNQDVIDLIDKKPNGILGILDSECQMPKGSATVFVQNLFSAHRAHPRMRQVHRVHKKGVKGVVPMNGFSINHYAGKVIYTVDDFLVKNADATSPDNVTLFEKSSNKVAVQLLAEGLPPAASAGKPKAGAAPAGKAPPAKGAPSKAFRSTGGFFSSQLTHLMHTLYDTTPYFVRCIKPNPEKKPRSFQWSYARPQLECGGIIECLRMLKCGYPTRTTYDTIFDRYGSILQPTPPDLNKRDFCEAILRVCGESLDRGEFQLGLSKVFFRPGKQEFLETLLQGPDLDEKTIKRIRRFLLNKRFQRARGAIRVHIVFTLMMRSLRAKARLKRLFDMGKIIANTFVTELHDARLTVAAINVQTAVRAVVAQRAMIQTKTAVQQIATFYVENRFRRVLNAELRKRIEVKLAAQSAREREEHERRELEKAQQRKAEAAAKEQQRLDKIRAEREQKEKEERDKEEEALRVAEERVRRVKEMEERERVLMEKERELARDAPLKDRIAELERKERDLLERETSFESERARFAVLAQNAVLHPATAAGTPMTPGVGEDTLARLVTKGAHFSAGDNTPDAASVDSRANPSVFLVVSEEGELLWYNAAVARNNNTNNNTKNNTNNSEHDNGNTDDGGAGVEAYPPEALLGKMSVLMISAVSIGKSSKAKSLPFLVVRGKSEGKPILLDVQTPDDAERNQWATALRYVARNMKDFGMISRPVGDPARGHWLVAELTDRVSDLEGELKANGEKERLAQLAAQQMADPISMLKRQGSIARSPSSISGGGPLAEKERTRLKELEEAHRKLQADNAELVVMNQHLESQVELLRLKAAAGGAGSGKGADAAAAAQSKEVVAQEVERRVKQARLSVNKAEEQVATAEQRVKQRQEIIRNTMAVLNARERELIGTEETMKVLGLAEEVDPNDATAAKLRKVREDQLTRMTTAKQSLLAQYEAMVKEVELLNQKNEQLAHKNAFKAQQEDVAKEINKKHRRSPEDEACTVS